MKKFALVLCLISTLLFTACGQEAAESSASIEETGFSQTQEVSETDGNAENSGYPETPETELKVNAPLAEDNEIGASIIWLLVPMRKPVIFLQIR